MIQKIAEDEYDTSLIMSMHAVNALETQKDPETQSSADHRTSPSSLPVEGGGGVKIMYYIKDFKEQYLDEYTREPLPHHLVRAAIRDELD